MNRTERGGGSPRRRVVQPDIACRAAGSSNQEYLGIGEWTVLRVEPCVDRRNLVLRGERGLVEPGAPEGEYRAPTDHHAGLRHEGVVVDLRDEVAVVDRHVELRAWLLADVRPDLESVVHPVWQGAQRDRILTQQIRRARHVQDVRPSDLRVVKPGLPEPGWPGLERQPAERFEDSVLDRRIPGRIARVDEREVSDGLVVFDEVLDPPSHRIERLAGIAREVPADRTDAEGIQIQASAKVHRGAVVRAVVVVPGELCRQTEWSVVDLEDHRYSGRRQAQFVRDLNRHVRGVRRVRGRVQGGHRPGREAKRGRVMPAARGAVQQNAYLIVHLARVISNDETDRYRRHVLSGTRGRGRNDRERGDAR